MMKESPIRCSILIVDDEEIVLMGLRETFANRTIYDVHATKDPRQALSLLRDHKYAVIICDQRMGEMSGLDFFQECKKIQPDASRVLITAVFTLQTVIDAVNKGEIYRFIAKPWIREDLIATVDNAVQRFKLVTENRILQEKTEALNQQLIKQNEELLSKIQQIEGQNKTIDKAQGKIESNFHNSLELCSKVIGTFHASLGKHTQDLVSLCKKWGHTMDLSEQNANLFITAAYLQNIGMLGLHRELIDKAQSKPSDMSAEDKSAYEAHPLYAETLSTFTGELEAVSSILRSCREHWDGTGYPDGKYGTHIPKLSRYLSVAIYFVESNNGREASLEQISTKAGSQFDPEAASAFLQFSKSLTPAQRISEISPDKLKRGHKLAHNLHNNDGLMIAQAGKVLDENLLRLIQNQNRTKLAHKNIRIYES